MTNTDALAEHLANTVDAALIVEGNADPSVAILLTKGWTLLRTEIVEGQRVRHMAPPESLFSR